MKIDSRCVQNVLVMATILLPGCSSLTPSSNNIPYPTTTSLRAESSTAAWNENGWGEKAKNWATASALSAALVLGGGPNSAMAIDDATTTTTILMDSQRPKVELVQQQEPKTVEVVTTVIGDNTPLQDKYLAHSLDLIERSLEDQLKVMEVADQAKVEVTVDTDNLVRTLDYFEGDMKKTMGAVTAPPPSVAVEAGKESENTAAAAEDVVVEAPETKPAAVVEEEVAEPAVAAKTAEKTFADNFVEKQYTIEIPGGEEDQPPSKIELSQLDITVAAAIVVYLPFGMISQGDLEREESMAAYRERRGKIQEEGEKRMQAAAIRAKQRAASEMQTKGTGRVNGEAAVNGSSGSSSGQPQMELTMQESREALDGDGGNLFSLSVDNPALQEKLAGASSITLKARIMQPGDPEGDFTLILDESMITDQIKPGDTKITVRGRLETQDK